jgi:cytochrome c553
LQICSLIKNGAAIAALLTIASHVSGQKLGRAPRIVTSYCSGCHGIDGNTELPYFPKLAGLNPTYAEKRLMAFKQPTLPAVDELFGRMRNGSAANSDNWTQTRQELTNMQGVAHALKPEVIQDAVQWYSLQAPAPGHSASKALIEQGKQVFTNGPRDQKALACMSCHGPDAQGKGSTPRLAGQNARYIEGQLAKFRKGDHRSAPEMMVVARELDADQARAAAAYLQSR